MADSADGTAGAAGAPAIRTVAYGSADYRGMLALREAVLRRPLGLPQTAADTAGEETQTHIAAIAGGRVVGTVILKAVSPARTKLRQMAVADEVQGTGLGARLVRHAEGIARDRGAQEMEMNARLSARGFYERLGYAPEGDVFTEVGLPHVRMARRLGAAGDEGG